MPILSSTLSAFVQDLSPFLDEVIGGDFTPWPEIGSQFLNKKTMDAASVDIGTKSTLGAFSVKAEIDQQAEDQYIIGPQLRVTAVEYAKRVPTSRIILEDARTFEQAQAILTGIGKDIRAAADGTKEILAHDILNSATGYNCPDGVALFDATHDDLSGGEHANLITSTALSETGLEAAMTAMMKLKNDRGWPIFQKGMRLIVPVALQWTAEKILGTDRMLNATANATYANNDINMMSRQGITLVVSPWLTSDTTWFLQAGDHNLNWYDRESERHWNDVDENRGIVEQGMTFRCAVGAGDWRSTFKITA